MERVANLSWLVVYVKGEVELRRCRLGHRIFGGSECETIVRKQALHSRGLGFGSKLAIHPAARSVNDCLAVTPRICVIIETDQRCKSLVASISQSPRGVWS